MASIGLSQSQAQEFILQMAPQTRDRDLQKLIKGLARAIGYVIERNNAVIANELARPTSN